VSGLAQALLAELSEADLDQLAALLAPRLAALSGKDTGDAWLRGAGEIAGYLACPTSRVYALSSAGRLPVQRDGSNLVARKSDLDDWIANGGGNRP
jgi:excisionase family DNA binding protein